MGETAKEDLWDYVKEDMHSFGWSQGTIGGSWLTKIYVENDHYNGVCVY